MESLVREAGGEVELLDLATYRLPSFAGWGGPEMQSEEVKFVQAQAGRARGFVFVTPEYHGNMSSTLKTWFDYQWEALAGKFAAVVAVTGGGGGDMSIDAAKRCFHWCHGFTLPFDCAVRPEHLDADKQPADGKCLDRMRRIAHDVVRYAQVIPDAFDQAKAGGKGVPQGVAGLHAKSEG